MGTPSRVGRSVEILSLAAAVGLAGYGGAFLSHWRERPASPASTPRPGSAFNPAHAVPPLTSLAPADPRGPEPRAVAARAGAIRRDADALREECRRAGGDWERWQAATETHRAALKARVAGLRQYPQNAGNEWPESRHEPLAALDDFPLVQTGADWNASYLYEGDSLAGFREGRAVLAARVWLAKQGVDLIFVPVPKMVDVYAEHFLSPCPADGVVNPATRRTLLELLEADVEAVDAWRLFRTHADDDEREYLYNTADTHWAPRAIRVMAKELADRVGRYRFGARARYGLPLYNATPGAYNVYGHVGGIGMGNVWSALTPEQQRRAEPVQTTVEPQVADWVGSPPHDNPESPVLVIGNSFVDHFREAFVKELNTPIAVRQGNDTTTDIFADFVREPEILAKTRVVVWVTTYQHMTRFKDMPPPVMAAARP